MYKVFNNENIAIATIVIIIGIIVISNNLTKALQHKYYLNIDSNNREYIEKIVTENYKLIGTLNGIVCMQGLGDWKLFLYYEDGKEDSITFGDSNEKVQPLHNYIMKNGYNEGEVSLNKIRIYFFATLVTIIYVVSSIIIKKYKFKNYKEIKDDKQINS